MATESRATCTFRLNKELAEMASEVIEVEGIKSADFFEPLVRDEIVRRHAANIAAIRAMRRTREKRRELESAELGEAGA